MKISNVIDNFVYMLGLKFALNYQNKILFLLRWSRILLKVKIKILKNLSPLKTVILNFVADIFLTVSCTFIASTKSSVDPCFVPYSSPVEETG